MNWRFDTRHLSPQQKSIIRKRDEEQKTLNEEKDRLKKESPKQVEIIEDKD
ncbi:hypothetical protein [Paenibacillus polymyxa]|uniref:hypothetical protein n=1 Tax=Paenibacillus polymyxa TaxID=1406 RepID=UPI00202516A3|nr:hypothetical protein [Paenibacillus polymyxa]URJ59009.1 hypothetical protein MF622_003609 [Paenibacillus polymyxa]